MELRHLRCFLAVAEELHFARAAERLHIKAILYLDADDAGGAHRDHFKYLLVSHDKINEARRLSDFLRFEVKS